MTPLEEIRSMTCLTITPLQAARVIGCNAQNIRLMAERKPEMLGFPVVRVGRVTKIPRIPFIQFMTGGVADGQPQVSGDV